MKSQTYQDLIKEICERFNLSHTSLKAITQAESSDVASALDDGYPLSGSEHVRLALYLRSQLNEAQIYEPDKTAEGYLMMLQLRAREAHIKCEIEASQRRWLWPLSL